MPRTQSTNNTTDAGSAVTRPQWLMVITFSAGALRLASRGENVSYDGDTYLGANFTVDMNRPLPSVELFNDQLAYSGYFIAEGVGAPVTLIRLNGDAPFGSSDGDIWWTGFMGEGSIDRNIQFAIRPNMPVSVPRFRATWEIGLNHVPAQGSEILTNGGTLTIRRNN